MPHSTIKKWYVATKIANRDQGIFVAYKLLRMGYQVTSRWLECEAKERPPEKTGTAWNEFCSKWAKYDMDDVLEADAIVVLVQDGCKGTWVEMGLALAANKQIHFVGDQNYTVFSRLEETPGGIPVTYHVDVDSFLDCCQAGERVIFGGMTPEQGSKHEID